LEVFGATELERGRLSQSVLDYLTDLSRRDIPVEAPAAGDGRSRLMKLPR
jgi:hypothetical protein